MINDTFYMLSDAEKKDVIDNIDTYSLDDIEAKLSIICVRNKVSFNEDPENPPAAPSVYSIQSIGTEDDLIPAWAKAVIETQKTM